MEIIERGKIEFPLEIPIEKVFRLMSHASRTLWIYYIANMLRSNLSHRVRDIDNNQRRLPINRKYKIR